MSLLSVSFSARVRPVVGADGFALSPAVSLAWWTAEPVTAVFAPFVELVKSWDLPGWLVHWGHPGNMVRLCALPVPCSQMTFLQFLHECRERENYVAAGATM